MENKRFRNQISWLMFIFSILVIWVHSYNVELFAGTQWGPAWDRAAQIETFWSVGVGQIAVPGFFMLSSYLFFRNFELKKLAEKWKSRFFSVVVPYTVWNFLYYLGYVTATRLPLVERVVGKETIPFNIEEMANAILHYSYAPIFWYLFQLILLLILAPVIYALIKQKVIGMCYLAALVTALYQGFGVGYLNTDALFYFSLAAYAAVHLRTWLESKGTRDRVMAGVTLLIPAVYSYGMMKTPGACVLWTITYRTLVPVSLFLMTSAAELPQTKPWMRQSLFLYAVHFIIVRFVNKGTAILLAKAVDMEMLPQTFLSGAALGIYFTIPVLVLIVSYLLARFLSRWLPFVWRVLSGGRNL
ncbi:MAG: acyltransferase [Lachnoclostridium sp.]|nr:acyltransferase [Lachnoclostridium sp.]